MILLGYLPVVKLNKWSKSNSPVEDRFQISYDDLAGGLQEGQLLGGLRGQGIHSTPAVVVYGIVLPKREREKQR